MFPVLKSDPDRRVRRSFWQACRAWAEDHGWPQRRADPPAAHLTGRRGERLAHEYLCRLGYIIVARNFRLPPAREEIDLIAWEGGELVFIEVKTRDRGDWRGPEAAVDAAKQQHLQRLGRAYARRHRAGAYRFDVVAIEEGAGQPPQIRLHRHAFGPSGPPA